MRQLKVLKRRAPYSKKSQIIKDFNKTVGGSAVVRASILKVETESHPNDDLETPAYIFQFEVLPIQRYGLLDNEPIRLCSKLYSEHDIEQLSALLVAMNEAMVGIHKELTAIKAQMAIDDAQQTLNILREVEGDYENE